MYENTTYENTTGEYDIHWQLSCPLCDDVLEED